MEYKEEKKKLILFLTIVAGIFLFSIMNVSALNWQTPPKASNATANFTDVNNYLNYLNQSKYPNGSQIPTNIVNQTTGTNWVGMTLDAILDLIYQMLGYNQNLTLSVNQTLSNQILALQLNLTNSSKIRAYDTNLTLITSSGSGTALSSDNFNFEITRITVTPNNLGTTYHFGAREFNTGDPIDVDREAHTGIWDIYKRHAIANDKFLANITSSSPDDTFIITVRYLNNFAT